jgi:hypothetical protein
VAVASQVNRPTARSVASGPSRRELPREARCQWSFDSSQSREVCMIIAMPLWAPRWPEQSLVR